LSNIWSKAEGCILSIPSDVVGLKICYL